MARGTEMRERHSRKGTARILVFYRDSIELEIVVKTESIIRTADIIMPGDDDGPICTTSSFRPERLPVESSEIDLFSLRSYSAFDARQVVSGDTQSSTGATLSALVTSQRACSSQAVKENQ
ncbi:hypothetical protein IW261DRAFT_1419519 [Armillaria novae-zelandiae]|uniref:Uncharacterized protein n=1 Tax=Armillaria novae-zelandiae TaxID=153914 RepID=A0AA39PAI5_9AGAR|nr:hypothetical protein IW261DRAFT_1419519 [Armillaria novae-zelandiae]